MKPLGEEISAERSICKHQRKGLTDTRPKGRRAPGHRGLLTGGVAVKRKNTKLLAGPGRSHERK
jgi:hypothetical protein